MEIEMKAKLNDEQIKKLISYMDINTTFLVKSDKYFSFNGIEPKIPKEVIRIRKEQEINAFSILNSVSAESGICAKDISRLLLGDTDSTLYSRLKGYRLKDDYKTLLTVKRKSTDKSGVERNEETESTLTEDAEKTFLKALEIANFKAYFVKTKKSFSFYINKMHAEIVSVDNIGPYLEIEYIVDSENDVDNTIKTIQDFFADELGILEFDKRDWPTIIEQDTK